MLLKQLKRDGFCGGIGNELYETVFERNRVIIPEFKKFRLIFVESNPTLQFRKSHWELLEKHCRYILFFQETLTGRGNSHL
jgi:hypothetical protein